MNDSRRSERIASPHTSLTSGDVLRCTFALHYIVERDGDTPHWGSYDRPLSDRMAMTEVSAGHWTITIPLTMAQLSSLRYSYSIHRGDDILRVEPPVGHRLDFVTSEERISTLMIHDRWIEPSPWHRLLSELPVSHLIRPGHVRAEALTIAPARGLFVGYHLSGHTDGAVRICGDSDRLGGWMPSEGIDMCVARHGALSSCAISGTEYKFVHTSADGECVWEQGANRTLPSSLMVSADMVICFVEEPRFGIEDDSLPPLLRGTVLPLFALRTERSYGIGDFGDALDFVDWLQSVGHSIFQMLPLYDTTFTYTSADSYPYSAITTIGLHPLFLDLRRLPYYSEHPRLEERETRAGELNALASIDYEKTMRLKYEVIDYCFEEWWAHRDYEDADFGRYWEEERAQILPYCLFCTVRDRNLGVEVSDYPPFESVMMQWVESHSIEGIEAEKEVMKHAFRQYHLHLQLMALRRYAEARGVMLKGDLPIGVSRDSVDAWQSPELFHLDMDAGAPPDAFSKEGQNWGFPTYNWARMEEDDYDWWRGRLRAMARYLHALRIDHILGFFRIWSIPHADGRPVSGHYVPAVGYTAHDVIGTEEYFVRDGDGHYHPMLRPEDHPSFVRLSSGEAARILRQRDAYYYGDANDTLWATTAIRRLIPLISASGMLLCAEDLGLLPHSVTRVLRDLELLSLEVLRMPKILGHSFVYPEDIPVLSVVTTSTHDTSSLRAWWQGLGEAEVKELSNLYGLPSPSPGELVRALRRVHATMLVLPLSDWCTLTGYGAEVKPEGEQINYPDRRGHVWNYRMPGSITLLPRSLE